MPGGRPAKFKSAEELQDKIDKYFTSLEYKDADGLLQCKSPTVSGLAYFLGFASRQSFYDYKENEEFSYNIARARLYIESFWESNLDSKHSSGAVFWLKNAGWKDKTEVENNVTISKEPKVVIKKSND